MKTPSRDLLILMKNEFLNQRAIDQEVKWLNDILRNTESDEQFCIAHELVDRNRITYKSKRILKESSFRELRAFRFLLNRN
jgi:hypothetical protein